MKTSIVDNYIDTINEAVNWVVLWTDPVLKGNSLAESSISYGKDLHQRVFRLSPYEIKDEILKNSTIENIKEYSSFFAKKLEVEKAAVVFPFGFNDIMFDSNNEYHRQILSLVREEKITQTEGNEILQQIAYIVKDINLKTEILQNIFAELKQCLTNRNNSDSVPKKLDTEKALEVLQRAVNANILDNGFQCIGLTIYQKRRLAELASEELGIKSKWKTFEDLWNIKGLAQVKMYEADQESLKIIDDLFSKDIIDKAKKK
ncbi:hypothetical protein [Parabacteroides sp.]